MSEVGRGAVPKGRVHQSPNQRLPEEGAEGSVEAEGGPGLAPEGIGLAKEEAAGAGVAAAGPSEGPSAGGSAEAKGRTGSCVYTEGAEPETPSSTTKLLVTKAVFFVGKKIKEPLPRGAGPT